MFIRRDEVVIRCLGRAMSSSSSLKTVKRAQQQRRRFGKSRDYGIKSGEWRTTESWDGPSLDFRRLWSLVWVWSGPEKDAEALKLLDEGIEAKGHSVQSA